MEPLFAASEEPAGNKKKVGWVKQKDQGVVFSEAFDVCHRVLIYGFFIFLL